MKKVMIIGKGPTAKLVEKTDNIIIAVLNSAVTIVDKADYFFTNDLDVMQMIDEKEFEKVSRFVIPVYPHLHSKPIGTYQKDYWLIGQKCFMVQYTEAMDIIKDKPYDLHQLHTEHKINAPKISSVDYNKTYSFGNLHTAGEVAVAYFLENGYTEFILNGIGGAGHSDMFEQKEYLCAKSKKNKHFQKGYDGIMERFKIANAKYKIYKE